MQDDAFDTIEITDWSQALDLPEVKHSTSVFRGQSDASWPLKTSLQREFERLSISEEYYLHKEQALLVEFRRRAHLYATDLPENDDIVGWLALMQHHGAPTRLLDFTYSFYVACYFAFSGSSNDTAVWSIDDLWLRTCVSPDCLREDSLNAQIRVANETLQSLHQDFRGGGRPTTQLNATLMIEPTRQIQRLAIQQGLFLMPFNIHAGVFTNLTDMVRNDTDSSWIASTKQRFKKFVFTKEVSRVGLRELRKMNVTAESLLPGIDGFAQSLRHTVLAV